jgi:hypothetical protein
MRRAATQRVSCFVCVCKGLLVVVVVDSDVCVFGGGEGMVMLNVYIYIYNIYMSDVKHTFNTLTGLSRAVMHIRRT